MSFFLSSVCVAGLLFFFACVGKLKVYRFLRFNTQQQALQPSYLFCFGVFHFKWFQTVAYWSKLIRGRQ